MNTNKLLGLVAGIIRAEPIEIIAALQEFVDEINNLFIDDFLTLEIADDDLTYPLYQIPIPDDVVTVKKVYDGGPEVPQTYTEEEHMAGSLVASTYTSVGGIQITSDYGNEKNSSLRRCYVDKSRNIIFNYSLTEGTIPTMQDTADMWLEGITGQWWHSGGTADLESTDLVIVSGNTYRLNYTLGTRGDPDKLLLTQITIGGNTYTDTQYLTYGDHSIVFEASATDQLILTPADVGNAYIKDIVLVTPRSVTSEIVIKGRMKGSKTITTMGEIFSPAAKNYAAARLYRLDKYLNKEQAAFYFSLYQKEIKKVDTNEIDITPRNYGSDL